MSILKYHNAHIKSLNTKDIYDYSYYIAKYNTKKDNMIIIDEYLNNGDYIENDFLQEYLNNSPKIRIRQIAHILLDRYLRNK